MANYPKDIIEKYRGVLKKTPDSQVFAPLAEAYRENGEIDLAEKVCKEGLRRHPSHVSAWVILAKILKDKKNWDEAIKALTQALKLSGSNILAHQLMGELHLEKRDTSNAIKSFKMVLLLNPHHTKVKKILERIESMSARDFQDDLFEFKKLSISPDSASAISLEGTRSQVIEPNKPESDLVYQRTLQRIISLVDAFIARNQLKQASTLLDNSLRDYPEDKDLLYRQKVLKTRAQPSFIVTEAQEDEQRASIRKQSKQAKLDKLNRILQRIHDFR
ncbi:MAG: tetratricopeptide repeat protein [Bdellovibrionaceae bacterium]|nr:tetratricopeptide repeat protein [Pseudobdellovibrionaceae bacterium]